MPSLFDSHEEFSEWFSKDIEGAAGSSGGGFNEHQLRRLHMILKPFMLRRVKRHVQNELGEKVSISLSIYYLFWTSLSDWTSRSKLICTVNLRLVNATSTRRCGLIVQ